VTRRAETRRLSHEEAEQVLLRHFAPGVVEAVVESGCYVVRWWPAGEDLLARGSGPHALEGESLFSFEEAIRELARRRPYLVQHDLDDPVGLLHRLTVGAGAGIEAVAVVP
jgi:hypothetical protein